MRVQSSFHLAAMAASLASTSVAATADAQACCTSLEAAGLKVLHPGSEAYAVRESSYFSVSAQLAPGCIVQPTSTAEVAAAITTLKDKTTCNWAIRAGGHMTWAGASNIQDGVTLDLGLMNKVDYSESTKVVSIGGGALWRDVYAALEPFGVTAPGGRTASVGVAGFLLGGGNNFFSSNVGLGCDNVVNFEVVLADGTVVNASRDENPDLHKVLKGGSGNFGVVTRIDMATVPVPASGKFWGGQVVYPLNTTDQHIEAYVKWVDNIPSYTAGSAVTFWAYTPAAGTVVSAALHDTSGAEWAPAYDDFQTIAPQLQDTLRQDTHLNFTVELEEPTGYRQLWVTLTGANDPEFIRAAVNAQAKFIEEWKTSHNPDFLNYITFQAMPRVLFQHSLERDSGNIIGMDRIIVSGRDAILFQMQHMFRSAEEESDARRMLMEMRAALKQANVQARVDVEWEYLGYADGAQNPLGTYGEENIRLMKDVAARVDPEGVFQKRVPGGFKISKVL